MNFYLVGKVHLKLVVEDVLDSLFRTIIDPFFTCEIILESLGSTKWTAEP